MAFLSTVDTRPHTLGNLLMVTGTFKNEGISDTGGNIDLSDLLAKIVVCGANTDLSTSAQSAGTAGPFALISGTTLTLKTPAREAGTWFAIGPRN
jgi:allophanate hydrolase subunit 2